MLNETLLIAERLSTRRRRPLPAVVRHWAAESSVAQGTTRRFVVSVRTLPLRGSAS